MRSILVGLSLVLAIACAGPDRESSVAQAQAALPGADCVSNEDCPDGQTCEDYDCDEEAHCASPGQGGHWNCCLNGNASCLEGWYCRGSGQCDDDPYECIYRAECGGSCLIRNGELPDIEGGCHAMSNGDCACVPRA